jgi:hypothetical protein
MKHEYDKLFLKQTVNNKIATAYYMRHKGSLDSILMFQEA